MSVIIGSARIGENGSVNYGRSGDQTGNEVSKQEWYQHPKRWNVLRPKKEEHAKKIAFAMNAACENDHVGYSQNTRYEAWDWCRNHNTYNPEYITENVNTDCSALVRLCLAYAGIFVKDFSTDDEKEVIMETGCFIDASGTASVNPEYLKAGDITEADMTELLALARNGVDNSQQIDLFEAIADLQHRVEALETADYVVWYSGKVTKKGEIVKIDLNGDGTLDYAMYDGGRSETSLGVGKIDGWYKVTSDGTKTHTITRNSDGTYTLTEVQ